MWRKNQGNKPMSPERAPLAGDTRGWARRAEIRIASELVEPLVEATSESAAVSSETFGWDGPTVSEDNRPNSEAFKIEDDVPNPPYLRNPYLGLVWVDFRVPRKGEEQTCWGSRLNLEDRVSTPRCLDIRKLQPSGVTDQEV